MVMVMVMARVTRVLGFRVSALRFRVLRFRVRARVLGFRVSFRLRVSVRA